jgi:hypothetical protein
MKKIAKATAKSQAITLELLDDLPDADMKPPENVRREIQLTSEY